ncbi:hypothetical protein BJ981_002151 [Sphaerisporangium krabiense]|uniref:Uncharacterized protein n=1 Tax=Sphaerisporangium krabiense TaxID=763782 RepID=A0A7W9DPH4_9ACTN|nr:hypothetical protein [Sphaerisporangium krabiense]
MSRRIVLATKPPRRPALLWSRRRAGPPGTVGRVVYLLKR